VTTLPHQNEKFKFKYIKGTTWTKGEGNKTVLGERMQIKHLGLGAEIISCMTGHKGKNSGRLMSYEYMPNPSKYFGTTKSRKPQLECCWNFSNDSVRHVP